MEIHARFIHPLRGFEKLRDADDRPFNPPTMNPADMPEAFTEAFVADDIQVVANAMVQMRKQQLHHDQKPFVLSPTYLGLSRGFVRCQDRSSDPIPPFKVAVEAGLFFSAWPDLKRTLTVFGARIVKPGHALPSFPGGRNWRKAMQRSTGLTDAILCFVFDRFEGAHLAVAQILRGRDGRCLGFAPVPEGHRQDLQAEWEEMMDTTDWRTGPNFCGQRTINRLERANAR